MCSACVQVSDAAQPTYAFYPPTEQLPSTYACGGDSPAQEEQGWRSRDIYALGALLFYLLAGSAPFPALPHEGASGWAPRVVEDELAFPKHGAAPSATGAALNTQPEVGSDS
jgi:serine/threonine protein kinase